MFSPHLYLIPHHVKERYVTSLLSGKYLKETGYEIR